MKKKVNQVMIKKRSSLKKYFLVGFLFSCQPLELEEVIERSRKSQPAWVQMSEKGVWTGGDHSYIVVTFRTQDELRQLYIKKWLDQEKKIWAKARIDDVSIESLEVADLYYEQYQKTSGVQLETINVIYALLKLDV
ncbi:MAG: hypothetical protein AB8C84_09490 [Oligoflexales bacterium]